MTETPQSIIAEYARAVVEERTARWAATVPAEFVDAHVGALDPVVGSGIRRWAQYETDTRLNLLIAGPVGTGKTYAACAAARIRFAAGATVLFRSAVLMLDDLRPDGDARLSTFTDPDLLVVDDLGRARASAWAVEQFGAIIDDRWANGRATIATTNLSADDLRTAIDEAAYSRLVRSANVARIVGPDRRGETR